MAGLIFFVARARVVDVGKAIEGELAVAFEPFRRRAAVDLLVSFVARVRAHGVDQTAATGDLLKRRVNKPAKHATLKRLMKIADLPKLFFDVALFDSFGESAQGF